MDKKSIRLLSKQRLDALAPSLREAQSQAIVERVRSLGFWQNSLTVLFYYPLRREPDVRPLLVWWASLPGRTAVLPRSSPGASSQFSLAAVRGLERLEVGRWKIPEPTPLAPSVDPESIDAVLVPGLAFDRSGMRVGRGMGWYDRLLSFLPPRTVRVGIFFSVQEWPALPKEAWDEPLGWIVTEKETIVVSQS
ncbi:5-formyltetrahydrofolate cyclo-ligase [Candidatus Methylacidithermus pantelleriae]|uniref:5-formyltetrahydrofolate cyclo-ligase n=1 Tax=Candidatus Methylacidithermus pantelleriae TaxID=2744239 RepID=A0A8J2BHR2_9BACT|nr:5-formyltetrahydrofolate cyclo-ligase [Candidatus Methylacidithermus pantelleriae]CAF0689939.1 5-formyltetrahydrofolate cyclo-ligase [Candidatus Methylacidithermus pantelleriae]